MNKFLYGILCSSALTFVSMGAFAETYTDARPLSGIVGKSFADCHTQTTLRVPMITWGADFATFFANGAQETTAKTSINANEKINVALYLENDFKKQAEDYMACRTPIIRGTQGMINQLVDLTESNDKTKMVAIYQLSWSKGDHLVVRSGIKHIEDLKGKTIALQAYGPHVDFLGRVLKDAGLSLSDVKIKWTQNLDGDKNSPMSALKNDSTVDAAFVITPDMLALTSNGKVGTGAEGSISGAATLISTRAAGRVISDVYVVRNDYFQANRNQIQSFVHGLMLGEEATRNIFTNIQHNLDNSSLNPTQSTFLTAAATEFKQNSKEDAGFMWVDAETAGYRGNAAWTDQSNPRSFLRVNNEIQETLETLGFIKHTYTINHAGWDYSKFTTGLVDVNAVKQPRFNENEVAKLVTTQIANGDIDNSTLFRREINFKPNQDSFPVDLYENDFKKIIDLTATYSGAVLIIEGHTDPKRYNDLIDSGASQEVLRNVNQSAKNLSAKRAIAVRDAILKYAENMHNPMDSSQFTIQGRGISDPKVPRPKTQSEWLSNMRVEFKIIQTTAEDDVFTPTK